MTCGMCYHTAMLPSGFSKSLQSSLLGWYQRNKRDLPWRKTKDPYKIWVSEIMLQQTQVSTVIPFYETWVKTFPTMKTLARSPLSKVLKHWEGLGYYRRARMLHEASRLLSSRGKIPEDAHELEKLPGIGRYTAGAICSIAFDKKVPILDGNVIRILSRIFAISKSVDLPDTKKTLWSFAEEILPGHSAGDFNQSLMELGATLCYPQNPDCFRCPVRTLCKAYALKKQNDFPVKLKKDAQKKIKMVALALQTRDDKILLKQQPEGHWWHELWTFPFWNNLSEMKTFLNGCSNPVWFAAIRHGVTNHSIELNAYRCRLAVDSSGLSFEGKFVKMRDLKKVALPAPHRKIADFFEKEGIQK